MFVDEMCTAGQVSCRRTKESRQQYLRKSYITILHVGNDSHLPTPLYVTTRKPDSIMAFRG